MLSYQARSDTYPRTFQGDSRAFFNGPQRLCLVRFCLGGFCAPGDRLALVRLASLVLGGGSLTYGAPSLGPAIQLCLQQQHQLQLAPGLPLRGSQQPRPRQLTTTWKETCIRESVESSNPSFGRKSNQQINANRLARHPTKETTNRSKCRRGEKRNVSRKPEGHARKASKAA